MGRTGTKTAAAGTLEWVLGGVSSAAVLMIGAYLVREGLREPGEPMLSAEVGAMTAEGVLPFSVRNEGGRTATAVSVSLTLERAGQPAIERRVIVDYVPGRSEVEGAFLLAPPETALGRRLSVEGYLDP